MTMRQELSALGTELAALVPGEMKSITKQRVDGHVRTVLQRIADELSTIVDDDGGEA